MAFWWSVVIVGMSCLVLLSTPGLVDWVAMGLDFPLNYSGRRSPMYRSFSVTSKLELTKFDMLR